MHSHNIILADLTASRIGVIVPCYNVKYQILSVLAKIGAEVEIIYVVDDCCPQLTGEYVKRQCRDPRVKVIFLPENRGVGGATLAGFAEAQRDNLEIFVKIDGDGQMDPTLIPYLTLPIEEGHADYTKGNRFHNLGSLSEMPPLRIFGNSILSFINKLTSGYWHVMDPTNGFIAIHQSVFRLLPIEKIEKRFFFESDMLFRLNTVRAVVYDVSMESIYRDEKSNLKIKHIILTFPLRYLIRLGKRVFYNYFLRDFNVCSLELIFGILLFTWGTCFGLYHWYLSIITGKVATTGTVMLSALPIMLGFQLLLAAISYDVANIPNVPLCQSLSQVQNQVAKCKTFREAIT